MRLCGYMECRHLLCWIETVGSFRDFDRVCMRLRVQSLVSAPPTIRMLRACVLDFKVNWDESLLLSEFAYNNSYLSSIGMTPYEALYGRKCKTPVCWEEISVRRFHRPTFVDETSNQVKLIQDRLKVPRSRQKSYSDLPHQELEFEVGDKVFVKVSPIRGTLRFGWKGKLAHKYIGSFQIFSRVQDVAY